MRSRKPPPQPKPKTDPRKTPPDDESTLIAELRRLGPWKQLKRVP